MMRSVRWAARGLPRDDREAAATGGGAPAPDLDAAARAIADARRILRTFTINTDGGFTLIEALVATAMVGILAAIGLPAYQHALEAARVAKAIGDIKAIDKDIQIHLVLKGCLPGSLSDIGRDQLRDSWGNLYTYHVLPGKAAGGNGGSGGGGGGGGNGKGGKTSSDSSSGSSSGSSGSTCAACNGQCVSIGQARKDHNLVPINSDFDLFSAGRDRKTTGPLTAKASQDDIVRGSDGAFVGLGRDY